MSRTFFFIKDTITFSFHRLESILKSAGNEFGLKESEDEELGKNVEIHVGDAEYYTTILRFRVLTFAFFGTMRVPAVQAFS